MNIILDASPPLKLNVLMKMHRIFIFIGAMLTHGKSSIFECQQLDTCWTIPSCFWGQSFRSIPTLIMVVRYLLRNISFQGLHYAMHLLG